MWSSIHLSLTPVWGECQYHVTAVWSEDAETDPVALTRSGIAYVHPHAEPGEMLAAVVAEMQARALGPHEPA
jgi:hypothetical protein